jgi:hypothetical protein
MRVEVVAPHEPNYRYESLLLLEGLQGSLQQKFKGLQGSLEIGPTCSLLPGGFQRP